MGKERHFIIISSAVSELLSPINTENYLGQRPPVLGTNNLAENTIGVGIKLALTEG